MKKINRKRYGVLIIAGLLALAAACKKEHDNDDTGFSNDIKNFVPQHVIDSMRAWGMELHEGKNPPSINGIYNFQPNLCVFDNSNFNRQGTFFDNYRYRFRDQDNSQLTIALDYKALIVSDSASGVGSFISGNNNFFTAFVDAKGKLNGINYHQIGFYSGEITPTGVKNFQTGFYLLDKDPDPGNILVAVGSSRIFNDADAFSGTNPVYRTVGGASIVAGK